RPVPKPKIPVAPGEQPQRKQAPRPAPDAAKAGATPQTTQRSPASAKNKKPEQQAKERPRPQPRPKAQQQQQQQQHPQQQGHLSGKAGGQNVFGQQASLQAQQQQQKQQQQQQQQQPETPKPRPRTKAPAAGSAVSSATSASVSESQKQRKPARPKQPKASGPEKPQVQTQRPPETPAMPGGPQQSEAAPACTDAVAPDSAPAGLPPPADPSPPPAAQPAPADPPPTKVCVRWLPADLPEHVFWRAAEPALPWFDAGQVGAVVERDQVVPDAEAAVCELPPTDAESDEQPGPEADISPLGPTKHSVGSAYESANIARLDEQPYWRRFVRGKKHRSSKAAEPSRAYIVFATADEASHFHRRFHGHVFGKDGVNTRAVVELALFQAAPSDAPPDPLESTIDQDAGFRRFLGLDPPPPQPAAAGPAVAAMSYAVAAAGADSGSDVTPLIRYLREIKGVRATRGKGTQARPATPKAPTPKAPTPKKQRKRN
ncbi:hypothetical protein H4R19_005420, partial [Coemansia spiralis]